MGPGSPSSPSGQHPGAASIQRLKGIQAKLAEAMNNEIIDPDTGNNNKNKNNNNNNNNNNKSNNNNNNNKCRNNDNITPF